MVPYLRAGRPDGARGSALPCPALASSAIVCLYYSFVISYRRILIYRLLNICTLMAYEFPFPYLSSHQQSSDERSNKTDEDEFNS
ncbi:hypothetical protein EVAR_97401_1 [Eumeta japonica]|uniref:Uncharacterized protein n=1 Tax=Eumeta variegata TaxID=151549 RepID=A0A4C1S8K3_EUMVA|nr:hypothetical protein EVAR_97401_1 [Eumeta japonica]